MAKGIVLKIENSEAYIMVNDGSFKSVYANKNWRIGQVINLKKSYGNSKRTGLLAAFAACFILIIFGGILLWNSPVAFVDVMLGSNVELSINRFNYIISANGLNEEGKNLIKNTKITGPNIEDSYLKLLQLFDEKGYLNDSSDGFSLDISHNKQSYVNDLENLFIDLTNDYLNKNNISCNIYTRKMPIPIYYKANRDDESTEPVSTDTVFIESITATSDTSIQIVFTNDIEEIDPKDIHIYSISDPKNSLDFEIIEATENYIDLEILNAEFGIDYRVNIQNIKILNDDSVNSVSGRFRFGQYGANVADETHSNADPMSSDSSESDDPSNEDLDGDGKGDPFSNKDPDDQYSKEDPADNPDQSLDGDSDNKEPTPSGRNNPSNIETFSGDDSSSSDDSSNNNYPETGDQEANPYLGDHDSIPNNDNNSSKKSTNKEILTDYDMG